MPFRVMKVSGSSMLPDYKNNDFIVIQTWFRRSKIQQGSIVVFRHKDLGELVKKVRSIDHKKREFSFEGLNPQSISSDSYGNMDLDSVLGVVIYHIASR